MEQLLARRLLWLAWTADTVLLPREVAWHLRGQRFSVEPVPSTAPSVSWLGPTLRWSTAPPSGPRTSSCIRRASWSPTPCRPPHRLLREGGVAVRDVTGLGRVLGTDHTHASFVLERRPPRRACWRSGRRPAAADRRLRPLGRARRLSPAGAAVARRHTDRLPGVQRPSRVRTRSDPSPRFPARPASAGRSTDLLAAVPVGTTLDLADGHDVAGWTDPACPGRRIRWSPCWPGPGEAQAARGQQPGR